MNDTKKPDELIELSQLNELIALQHKQLVSLCEVIIELQNTVKDQTKKIIKLSNTINTLETKVIAKTQRDLNKALRSYSLKRQDPISFVPSLKTPLSKLFDS